MVAGYKSSFTSDSKHNVKDFVDNAPSLGCVAPSHVVDVSNLVMLTFGTSPRAFAHDSSVVRWLESWYSGRKAHACAYPARSRAVNL